MQSSLLFHPQDFNYELPEELVAEYPNKNRDEAKLMVIDTWWHGKSLDDLQNQLSNLSINLNKEVLIAETSYPFTLGWNDWTNNNVGLEEHLILPDYPASPRRCNFKQ